MKGIDRPTDRAPDRPTDRPRVPWADLFFDTSSVDSPRVQGPPCLSPLGFRPFYLALATEFRLIVWGLYTLLIGALICICPPAPTGHTAVKPFNAVLVSLLCRHPAIYCQVSILLSRVKCYSSSIAKVLRRFFWFLCPLCCLRRATEASVCHQSTPRNLVPLNHLDA